MLEIFETVLLWVMTISLIVVGITATVLGIVFATMLIIDTIRDYFKDKKE